MTGYSTTYGINKNTEMTKRELEVLVKITEGLTNKEIAKELFISTHTVKAHASSIYRKLNVESRIEAAMQAKDKGIV